MPEINFLTAVLCTIASFICGALWYSPLLFMKPWSRAAGVDPKMKIDNPAKIYGLTFIMTLVSAFAMVLIVGNNADAGKIVLAVLAVGIGTTATSLGINYQFSGRTFKHWLIDSGFHLVRFAVMGLVIWLRS